MRHTNVRGFGVAIGLVAAIGSAASCAVTTDGKERRCLASAGFEKGDTVDVRLTDCGEYSGVSTTFRLTGADYREETFEECSALGCASEKSRYVVTHWKRVNGDDLLVSGDGIATCPGTQTSPAGSAFWTLVDAPSDGNRAPVSCQGDADFFSCRADESGPDSCRGELVVNP